jgi:transcriptional regulator with XRE-family HTH domain
MIARRERDGKKKTRRQRSPHAGSTKTKLIPLGDQIRDLREARRWTLAQVARAIGKSIGYLSLIERNRSEVTVSTLKAISDALGVQISWFFQGYDLSVPAEHGYVVRRNNRRHLKYPGVGLEEDLLSPTMTGEAELILSTFAPGAKSGEQLVSRMAEQSGYVIAGQLELQLHDRSFMLQVGDSFRIGRGEAYTARNPAKEPSVSLWVIAPPRY